MNENGYILIINPGSTSTKLAIYAYDLKLNETQSYKERLVDHAGSDIPIMDQLNLRQQAVDAFLDEADVDLQIIMARGGPLRALEGGTYLVEAPMLDDLSSGRYATHASNLGALIGNRIGSKSGIAVYITDPVTTDEFEPLARISGVPGIERKSRSHALNMKASLRKLCQRLEKDVFKSSWVVCHMGGGISVGALRDGKIIDVNDALLGMGPFSPERAGALPIAGILDLAFKPDSDRGSIERLLSKRSGLMGYLGTSDLKAVEDRINGGDKEADLIFQALAYQIAKEISAMASVLQFDIEGVLLTGGMAHSSLLCNAIINRINRISDVFIESGENEIEALAQAGLRVLLGVESIKTYAQRKICSI